MFEETGHSFLSANHLSPLLWSGERQSPLPSTEAEECQRLTSRVSLLQGQTHTTPARPTRET